MPAIGLAATIGVPVPGNQVTVFVLPSFSFVIAHLTGIWPADGCLPRVTLVRGGSSLRCIISPGVP